MKLILRKNGIIIQKNIHADLVDIAVDVEENECYDYIKYKNNRITAMALTGDEFCWEIQED